jgi:hypothetical protein
LSEIEKLLLRIAHDGGNDHHIRHTVLHLLREIGATVAAISSPSQGLDSFFAAFSAGSANLAATADLLATSLALPVPTPPLVPTLAAMTPATASTLPSLPAGTDQDVTVPSPLSSTPTSVLAPRAANGSADDAGTDMLTLADPTWDGDAAPWSAG